MNVLGINFCSYDSSAALVQGGPGELAAMEERFRRIKEVDLGW